MVSAQTCAYGPPDHESRATGNWKLGKDTMSRMFLAASESPRWDIWLCRFLSCVICSCAVQLAAFKQVKASLEKTALQLTSIFPGLELLDAVSTVLLDVSAVVTLAVTSTE